MKKNVLQYESQHHGTVRAFVWLGRSVALLGCLIVLGLPRYSVVMIESSDRPQDPSFRSHEMVDARELGYPWTWVYVYTFKGIARYRLGSEVYLPILTAVMILGATETVVTRHMAWHISVVQQKYLASVMVSAIVGAQMSFVLLGLTVALGFVDILSCRIPAIAASLVFGPIAALCALTVASSTFCFIAFALGGPIMYALYASAWHRWRWWSVAILAPSHIVLCGLSIYILREVIVT